MIHLIFTLENNCCTIQSCLDSLEPFLKYISSYSIKDKFPEDTLTLEIIEEWANLNNIKRENDITSLNKKIKFNLYGDERIKYFNSKFSKINLETTYAVTVESSDYSEKQYRVNMGSSGIQSRNIDILDITLEKITDDPLEYERRALNHTFTELDKKTKNFLDIAYFYRKGGNLEEAKKFLEKVENKNYKFYKEKYFLEPSLKNIFELFKLNSNNLDSYYLLLEFYFNENQYDLCYSLLKDGYKYYENTENLEITSFNIKEKYNKLVLKILENLGLNKEMQIVSYLIDGDKKQFRLVRKENILESSLVDVCDKIVINCDLNISQRLSLNENVMYYIDINEKITDRIKIDYLGYSREILISESEIFFNLSREEQIKFLENEWITIENIKKTTLYLDIEPNEKSLNQFLELKVRDTNIIYIGVSESIIDGYYDTKLKESGSKYLFVSNCPYNLILDSQDLLKQIGLETSNFNITKYIEKDKYLNNNNLFRVVYKNNFKETINIDKGKTNILDKAFFINLNHRKDRLKSFNENFRNILDLSRIEAIKETPGWVGCFKSHQRALRIAKSLNLNSVLVLEDDCVLFRPDEFSKEWLEIKNWLDNNTNEWDIFLGGCANVNDKNVLGYVEKDLGIVRLNFSTALHFIYYNKTVFDKIINHNINPKEYKPIDLVLPEICKNKILTRIPFIAKQLEDFSDIENKSVNYDILFGTAESIIKKKLENTLDNLGASGQQINKKVISPVLMGGLGNRLFQIASAYGISKKLNRDLIVVNDIQNAHSTDNYFESIFKKINRNQGLNIDKLFKEPEDMCYSYLEIPDINDNLKLYGYFQNDNYFKEYRNEILELFRIEETRYKLLTESYTEYKDRYFIHIRRGDYVNHPIHDVGLEKEYYKKSIRYIKDIDKNAKFYCFSDDIEYCKNLEWLKTEDVKYIKGLNEINSLYLMSLCYKGGIGCNSTFSWWGGWLNTNKNKLVIFPNKWLNTIDKVPHSQDFFFLI